MNQIIIVVVLATLAFASALPSKKHNQLKYRNLYVEPIGGIKDGDLAKPRIIGGNEAVPNSIKYQAFLTVSGSGGGWYCGGSVISTTVILTAGHCVDGGYSAEVVLGAHKAQEYESTQLIVSSTNLVRHENYDETTITNDVGLIILSQAITFNTYIDKVKLPGSGDTSTFEGSTARISGWGLTDGYGTQLSEVLMYVDVKVISNTQCSRIFNIVIDSTLCTSGDDNTGSCNGDSGGPLVELETQEQIGIVSFGVQYCLAGYPSGFARITSFLPWIERHL